MKTHKDLDVWKMAMNLVTDIYKVTREFPKEEIYGLSSQMRRSAVSIPSNTEGAARKGIKENINFLYIALGSISELETQLLIAQRLDYLENYNLIEQIEQLRPKLINYIRYVKMKLEG